MSDEFFADKDAAIEHFRAWAREYVDNAWNVLLIVTKPNEGGNETFVYSETNEDDKVTAKLLMLDRAREAVLNPDLTDVVRTTVDKRN